MQRKDFQIVVLAKQVPDTKNVGKDAMNADGTINRAALPAIFNPDDMKALEMALMCRDIIKAENNIDVKVTVITMGPPRANEIIREALYRGADNGFVVSDKRFAGSDTLATSYALSMAIEKLGRYDIVFTGRQAIDGDTAQVGPQTAEKLGVPQITYADEIIAATPETIRLKRVLQHGIEVVEAKLPVLVTVHGNAHDCRSRHAHLVIKKKNTEIPMWTADDLNPEFERLGLKGSPTKVKNIENVVLAKKENIAISSDDEGIKGLIEDLTAAHIF